MATSKVSIILEAKDRASREIAQAEGAMGKLRATWRSAAIVATALAAAIGGTAVALDKLAKRGGEVIGVQNAFNKLFGEGEAAIGKMREASRGLLSDYDLMTQANRAAALGAAKTAEQFAELTEVSLALGRAQGVDAKLALESLALGIGRQSRLLLDNLGIIVNVEQATAKYASSIGKSVGELNDAQRAEAFRTAAMEAARKKLEELGGITETNADNIQRMKIAAVNAKDAFAEWVAESPAIERGLDRIAAGVRGIANAVGALNRAQMDNSMLGGLGTSPAAGAGWVPPSGAIHSGASGVIARPGGPRLPSAPVPGAPDFTGVPTLGEAFMGLDSNWAARFERPVDIQTPKAHGRFHSGLAPKGLSASQVAMAGAGVPEGFAGQDPLNEVEQAVGGMNAAAMAAVGSLHALGLAAMDGSLGLDDFAASLGNVLGSAVGGWQGALIGAAGSLLGALFSEDKPMPIRMTDVSDRAASKLTEKREGPDVQVFLNGNLASPEELAALGYRLKRQSRLRGESVGGV